MMSIDGARSDALANVYDNLANAMGDRTMAQYRDIATLWRDTLARGGCTVNARTLGDAPPVGWAVGQSRGVATQPCADEEAFWHAVVVLWLRGVPYIGTWLDNGIVHVDAVDIIHDTDHAIEVCLQRGEDAIYNLATGVTLRPSR